MLYVFAAPRWQEKQLQERGSTLKQKSHLQANLDTLWVLWERQLRIRRWSSVDLTMASLWPHHDLITTVEITKRMWKYHSQRQIIAWQLKSSNKEFFAHFYCHSHMCGHIRYLKYMFFANAPCIDLWFPPPAPAPLQRPSLLSCSAHVRLTRWARSRHDDARPLPAAVASPLCRAFQDRLNVSPVLLAAPPPSTPIPIPYTRPAASFCSVPTRSARALIWPWVISKSVEEGLLSSFCFDFCLYTVFFIIIVSSCCLTCLPPTCLLFASHCTSAQKNLYKKNNRSLSCLCHIWAQPVDRCLPFHRGLYWSQAFQLST